MAEPVSSGSGGSPITMWEALGYVWELLALIALPTISLAFAGRWVDARLHSTPWATLTGLFLALLICAFIVRRKGLAIASRLKNRH